MHGLSTWLSLKPTCATLFATFTALGECVWRVSALLSTSLMVNDSLALTRELFIGRGVSELHMAQAPRLYGCFFNCFLSARKRVPDRAAAHFMAPVLWCTRLIIQRFHHFYSFFSFLFFISPSFIPPLHPSLHLVFPSVWSAPCHVGGLSLRFGTVAVDRHS